MWWKPPVSFPLTVGFSLHNDCEIFNLTLCVLWFLLSWKVSNIAVTAISNITVISILMHSLPLGSCPASLIRKFPVNSLQQGTCAICAPFSSSDWILSHLTRMTHGQSPFVVSILRLLWYPLLGRAPLEADPESQAYFHRNIYRTCPQQFLRECQAREVEGKMCYASNCSSDLSTFTKSKELRQCILRSGFF